MIDVLYLQLLKWGNKVEKYEKLPNTVIITTYNEPDCYANETKPHSYKSLTEYTLSNPKIYIKSGYENDNIRVIFLDITKNAKYYLRPVK